MQRVPSRCIRVVHNGAILIGVAVLLLLLTVERVAGTRWLGWSLLLFQRGSGVR